MKIFKDKTKEVSSSKFNSISFVFPIFNMMLDELEDMKDNCQSRILKGPLQKCYKKMKSYYAITDLVDVFYVSTGKHLFLFYFILFYFYY